MSRRERLPGRRPAITSTMVWHGIRLHISVGLTDDGRVLEVFIAGAWVGSDRDHLLADFGVLTSRLLQHGDRLVDIAKGIGRLPLGESASILGAVVDHVVELEAELSQ
jgi:hypothetical protein